MVQETMKEMRSARRKKPMDLVSARVKKTALNKLKHLQIGSPFSSLAAMHEHIINLGVAEYMRELYMPNGADGRRKIKGGRL